MEPIESSETSAYNNTLTPGTYPKEKKLQCKYWLFFQIKKKINDVLINNVTVLMIFIIP